MQHTKRAAAWAAAVLVAIGLGGMSGVAAMDFEFTGSVRFTDGGAGYGEAWVDVGDANNDGRDDLSVILRDPIPPFPWQGPWSSLPKRAHVRLQTESGTLAPAIVLSVPMQKLNTVEATDLDNDGQNELVVGYDGGLLVYRWNGSEFVPTAAPASFECFNAVIGDLDGNGTRDVVCNDQGQVIAVYHVAADGTVGAPIHMLAANSSLRQFKLDDVTGDGRVDLLQADGGLWSFLVYPNDGAGGFLPARAYAWPMDIYNATPSHAIEAFDVDGDGALEVVVGRGCSNPCGDGNLLVYRRDTSGHLRFWRYVRGHDSPDTLEKHDVDGDGYLDLVGGHRGQGSISRFMGGPNGINSPYVVNSLLANGMPLLLDLGDLNGDGRTDLAATTSGLEAELVFGIGKRSTDVDGNFRSDLVWRDAAGGRNLVWRDGRSYNQRQLPVLAAPWTIKSIADFNGDDTADLLWRNPGNGANMIWLGADATKTHTVAPLAPEWQVAGSGDFDGDLSDDLLWRHATTGANRIWPGADLAQAIDINTEADLSWKVAGVGDFDGDRMDDILWRHATTGRNRVWFSANAATQVELAPVPNLAWKVAGVADFNRDGMDDVIWRNNANGAQSLWRSADATRQQAVAAVANQAWQIVAVGDYYRDGKADLMWRHMGSGEMLIWHDASVATQERAGVGGTSWKVMP